MRGREPAEQQNSQGEGPALQNGGICIIIERRFIEDAKKSYYDMPWKQCHFRGTIISGT